MTMRHGQMKPGGAIPQTRFAPMPGEELATYMGRIAAATSFAYDMPPAQFEQQADFSYLVDSMVLPSGTIGHGRVRGRVRLIRDDAKVATSAVDALFIYVMVSGSAELRPGRRRIVGPGDILVHDLAWPATILLEGYELFLLVIGRGALPATLQRRDLHGAVVPGHHPLAAIVRAMIAGIHGEAARLHPAHASAAFDHALALLGAVLEEATLSGAVAVSTKAAAEAVIDGALGDVDLSPAGIAAQIGVSRATLYRAFKPYGGVRRVIADRRLHRAWTLCGAHPAPAPAEVARRCGYSSAIELDRALRAGFGAGAREIGDASAGQLCTIQAGAAAVVENNRRRITGGD